jgi:hypothetical protein
MRLAGGGLALTHPGPAARPYSANQTVSSWLFR